MNPLLRDATGVPLYARRVPADTTARMMPGTDVPYQVLAFITVRWFDSS
jgi:hypothetical protein